MPTMLQAGTSGFLERLDAWDRALFIKVNNDWISAVGDVIFPVLRHPPVWIPLYVGLLLFVVIRFRWKALPWIVFAGLCITITDQLSSQVLKSFFDRLRPCQDPDMAGLVRLLVDHCPGNASFTSSHAVNHFGIGTFYYFTLRASFKRWALLFFLWAASICYAQVYVGVHYPGDVIAGALVGILLGGMVSYFFDKYFGFRRGFGRPGRV